MASKTLTQWPGLVQNPNSLTRNWKPSTKKPCADKPPKYNAVPKYVVPIQKKKTFRGRCPQTPACLVHMLRHYYSWKECNRYPTHKGFFCVGSGFFLIWWSKIFVRTISTDMILPWFFWSFTVGISIPITLLQYVVPSRISFILSKDLNIACLDYVCVLFVEPPCYLSWALGT